MTYMYPTYIPVSTPKNVSSDRYGLFLYHEGWKQIDFNEHIRNLNGVPVLFIPGNGGSYSLQAGIGGFSENMIPTVGFNMRKVTKGNVTIKLWDLGGQPIFRSMWERYLLCSFCNCSSRIIGTGTILMWNNICRGERLHCRGCHI